MVWNCIWSITNARSVFRASDVRWFVSEELPASGQEGIFALKWDSFRSSMELKKCPACTEALSHC